ncbi:Dabb family protein [Terriglobus albidus]|uniref:Dabb family protein n=2 Tax=Terriglobus albidus TaxID=1592106 RepID=A0A5B9EIB8_9BACT|nr:Dabb family protein [Terriglobus albidus]
MFIHGFLFRWQPGATEEQIARAQREILAFQGVIPGLREVHVGENLADNKGDYTFAGVMIFESKEIYAGYSAHPAHQALLQWLMPLIEPIEFDLEG